jgi:parvulin-like peptidyl-prolyl isomerase
MESVAVVNGKDISKNIFEIKLDSFIQNNYPDKIKYTDSEYYEIKSFVIDKLIDDLLVVQYAEKNNIYAELHEVKAQFNELTSEFSSHKDFENSLQSRGLTVDQIFEDIKNEIVISKVFNQELNPFIEELDESDLQEFYLVNKKNFIKGNAVKASHIFFKIVDFDNTKEIKECRIKAQKIFDELINGKNFIEMAKQYSECNSAKFGGNLGVFTYDEIDEEFARVVFSMQPGTISKPFLSDSGFHIAFLEEIYEDYVPPFDKVKTKLKEFMIDIIKEDAIEKFLDELWQKADITINEY